MGRGIEMIGENGGWRKEVDEGGGGECNLRGDCISIDMET